MSSREAGVAADQSGERWVPWFVLAVSLGLTGLAGYYVYTSAAATERARFNTLVGDAREQATRSLDRYLSALRGLTGLYAASGLVDHRAFDAYTRELDLPIRYRGLTAVGFARRVTAADRARFSAEARAELGPDFKIWPATSGGTASDAVVVEYVAPPTPERRPVIGFDMASDPARRPAMASACDLALPIVTPGLTLVRSASGERRPGFLLYVPIYGPDGVPPTPDERRAKLAGFIYAGFRSEEVFPYWVGANVSDRLRLRVVDGPPSAAADPAAALYDSDAARPDGPSARPRMRAQFPLLVFGRVWTVDVSERPGFYMDSDRRLAPSIVVGGVAISLVLFAVTRAQTVARGDAERSAANSLAAQRALAASQSRLRRLVDANLIGVFFCDLGGEVSGGNDEFFRLLDQPKGGDGGPLLLGQITVADGRPAVEQALRQASRDGVSPAFETAFVRRDGSAVPVLLGVASVEVSDDADRIPGAEAVAFALDLSDRHRAERELREAKEAAERANRSKDQFLAVLSHELRTPLTPVLAATAAASADGGLPAAVRDEMAMIHRNVEMEARLIDDLLDLTRVGRGKLQLRPTTADVHRAVADAVAVCPPDEIAAKGLVVRCELSAAEHFVHGDPARLQQVFWNLVKNAIKFTQAGGRVTVSTANAPAGAGDEGGRPWLVVTVADTGLGIEADVLPKVFDAFEQGSAARAAASGGLGLGLAISRGLVEAHSGQITVASDGAGRGATFTVRLRTTAAPVDDPPPAVGPADAAASGAGPSYRILLVEDHVDTARVLARLLGHAGHRVTVAHTCGDALRVSAAQPFDLLVSDLGLPDGSGTDLAGPFRARQQGDGPVGAIALTGFGAEADVARARAAGFDEHLTKPVAFGLLQQTIARVMGEVAAGV